MNPRTSARRALSAALLASALSLAAPTLLTAPAHAEPPGYPALSAPAEECAADDQACKDRKENEEQEKKVEEQQKETEEDAKKAEKTIEDVGKKLEECKPGSSSCMEGLTGPGMGEKQGVTDMTSTIKDFKPGPAGDASAAVTSTCSGFLASLPTGSADDAQSPFPVSQLCALLGG
ncbi:hypothetical protein [Streptomyces xanthophaeus]|uniref:hypothetical protein n=1 Tax=Streptomyces xanthophaeus TaxID=67385 RepID=UPI00264918B1|nr:hypothetical protein [Streptomyces xanthophaeus]